MRGRGREAVPAILAELVEKKERAGVDQLA